MLVMNMVVMVAAHKPYWMPQDAVYHPVLVGACGKTAPVGWLRDDTGDNISGHNQTFCELTGHYWMWKNVNADIYGLCHYRRYFSRAFPSGKKRSRILSGNQLYRRMQDCDVLLPKKRHYWIETNYTQYVHAHHEEDLRATREILSEKYPDYLSAWDLVMQRRSGHRFNMFLMRKEAFMNYSRWLFEILFELEHRLNISEYSFYDRRVFGFIGERLLDVWLTQQSLAYRECPIVNLEPQHWIKKINSFLKRKYCSS